ncbi:MAG: 23S rRNA (pseudouridine(1915)-N(3))-methyltransferase RlmH [Saprospiraceae bacterium]|nr:23S rRNA (pseudouridine(1915)-N(3))-methyltransferase RlmH [Saprospiraceae bacterium]
MRVEFWMIGKTNEAYLKEGMEIYQKRLVRYLPFHAVIYPDIKNAGKLSSQQLKQKEGEFILSKLKSDDFLILLDEKGKQFTSEEFAQYVDHKHQLSYKRIIFQIGGAFGFSDAMYQRANAKLGLSKMTFSHQMIRLFFLEQLYRAMTILRNEPYHNH